MDRAFRQAIRALTGRFVADLVAAVDASLRRHAPVGNKPGHIGRRPRRDSVVIDAVAAHIARIAKENPKGISSAKLLRELRLPRVQVTKPLALALANRQIRRQGWARGTMYFPGKPRRRKK